MPSSDLPGVPTPSDEDYLLRRIEALERAQRELGPSLMAATADAIGAIIKVVNDSDYSSEFALPVDGAADRTVCEVGVSIPDGYSQCVLTAVADVSATNMSGGADQLYVAIRVNSSVGDTGPYLSPSIPNGQSSRPIIPTIRQLTGLTPGGEIMIEVLAQSWDTTPWGTGTFAGLAVVALFFK